MRGLITTDAIRGAAAILGPVAIRTPLVRAPWLEELVGAEIRLKCENLQRIGSFKFPGAYVAHARLPEEARHRGVVAYSAGNHAQAVALAARLFGTSAVVVMSTNVVPVEVEERRAPGCGSRLSGDEWP